MIVSAHDDFFFCRNKRKLTQIWTLLVNFLKGGF